MEAGFKPWQTCNEIVWCKRSISSPFHKISRIHENIFVFQKGNPQVCENNAPYEDIIVPQAFNGITSESALQRYFSVLKAQVKASTFELGKIPTSSKHNDEIYHAFQKQYFSYQENVKLPSIWSFTKENNMHRNFHNIKHPTVKPTLLLRRLIKLFTKQDDVVLDCFLGSGTTAIASLQEGRHFIGSELQKDYFDIAVNRCQNWKEDLERQEEWLEKRGVEDFKSDIDIKNNSKQKQNKLF